MVNLLGWGMSLYTYDGLHELYNCKSFACVNILIKSGKWEIAGVVAKYFSCSENEVFHCYRRCSLAHGNSFQIALPS